MAETETPTANLRTVAKVAKPSAAAMGTVSDTDERGNTKNVQWADKAERLTLPFTAPGLPTNVKNIYTIKAIDPTGVLVQLPLADQINNNVASPEDFVGLRIYQRKGFNILFDMATATGVYCPLWDCWAPWSQTYRGACSPSHEAQLYAQTDNAGKFSSGATTSRQWLGQ